MRNRLLFVGGLAVGYVLGARAGRTAYDAIVDRVQRTKDDPRVQDAAAKAKAAVEERAPEVVAKVEQAASTVSAAAGAAKEAGESTPDGTDAAETDTDTVKTGEA